MPVPGARFAEVPVGSIEPNPRQPRTIFDEDELAELVHSVREVGVLQPIVVRPVQGRPERYELIMGERRWRASQQAGLERVPAIVRETADDDLLRDALLENLHRSQLNPLEEAAAYQQLLDDFGCTHDELAGRIGRSRPQISNTLRLLRLPPLVQRRVAAGVLSAGHARALLGLTGGAAMERLAQRIVAEGLSVRAVEEVVALGGDDEPAARARRPRAGGRRPELDDLAQRLSDRFDTRVQIALGRNKGRVSVEFASVDDLNRIIALLAPDDVFGRSAGHQQSG
jgi:ParB family transcriptional regulator, chromosome partitioning protein